MTQDEGDRDPRSWKFFVKDAIIINKEEDTGESAMSMNSKEDGGDDDNFDDTDIFKWVEVSHIKEYNLQNEPSGFTVYKFTIKGKQRIVSAVKLEIEKNNGSEGFTQLN